jgi:hypothetical protein
MRLQMSSFKEDYDWQFRFVDSICRIVGPLLVSPAPFDLDTREATDMLVLCARDMRIACRIRRPGFASLYPWQFTIRSWRDNGATTELSKIVNGWGDWMFYGHSAPNQRDLGVWYLIDLSAFRSHAIRHKELLCPIKKSNGDGTHFLAFNIKRFPPKPSILIATNN